VARGKLHESLQRKHEPSLKNVTKKREEGGTPVQNKRVLKNSDERRKLLKFTEKEKEGSKLPFRLGEGKEERKNSKETRKVK